MEVLQLMLLTMGSYLGILLPDWLVRIPGLIRPSGLLPSYRFHIHSPHRHVTLRRSRTILQDF